jgi:soluble lytic murein transglycosylase
MRNKFAGCVVCIAAILLVVCPGLMARPVSDRAPAGGGAAAEKQLEKLSRALKQGAPLRAYAQLSAFAERKSSGALGMRAALALGYFDYTQGRYADAAKWLERAKGDPLLGDYSLYWGAENALALGNNVDALAGFEEFRKTYPDSVMTDQALQSLGAAALAANQPARAVAALTAYAHTSERPPLLFLRAEAREEAGQPVDAAADYESIYMRYSASEQAREAGLKLAFLRSSMGGNIPPLPLTDRMAHAAILFNAKDWDDARTEYTGLLPELAGADHERAELRILECGVALGASPQDMAALKINDPDVDAERSYALAGYYRDAQQELEMVAAVEAAALRAPTSHWAEAALFLSGNYYWVQLERDRASGYYQRLEEQFPLAPAATPAQWRVAWTAALKRDPAAADLLQKHLERFPGSPYTPDGIYWLGRLAEEAGDAPLGRSFYAKLAERYPLNYFAGAAAVRLRALGSGPRADADVLAKIPAAPPAPVIGDAIPAAAQSWQTRADALRSIAFDSSAELELRAAYAATGEPRLLLEAAQADADAGHYGAAIVTVRQIYPHLEAYAFSDVRREAWQAAYALPFEASIRRWSGKARLDPMLVAGLIHQESAFNPEAHSNKNAFGLMQLLPETAKRMARQVKVRYSEARLFDPDYNVHLGTAYLASLEKQFGSVELALAAYNAGEDRVTFWTEGQKYRELPEFVDSVPFTETRDYIEIITRNAEVYRELYAPHGPNHEPGQTHTRHGG